MELFFSPFACSLASHITAREAGLPLDLTSVTISTKRTAAGDDYLAVNPKGQVPALRLDDGTVMTETPAVLQYLADQAPGRGLLPAPGSRDRYSVLEWSNFVGTEIHKLCFHPMFAPEAPAEAKAWARSLLDAKVDFLDARLRGRDFVATDAFTIADAHLTWALTLCEKIGVDFASRPAVAAYLARMHARPAVGAALQAEITLMQAASA